MGAFIAFREERGTPIGKRRMRVEHNFRTDLIFCNEIGRRYG